MTNKPRVYILNENEAKQIITPVFYENEHINANVIAPTSKGYFDLILDEGIETHACRQFIGN